MSTESLEHIAGRLRELRERSGDSLETAAEALQVTSGELAGFESGREDIPVGFLYKAAKRYQVELSVLLTGQQPRLHMYDLIRKGQGLDVERRTAYRHQSLGSNFYNKRMEPFLVTVEPTPAGASLPTSNHPGQEFHFLLEGRLRVVIEDHELILEPGDSLIFDSSHSHGLQALDDRPATFLAVIV